MSQNLCEIRLPAADFVKFFYTFYDLELFTELNFDVREERLDMTLMGLNRIILIKISIPFYNFFNQGTTCLDLDRLITKLSEANLLGNNELDSANAILTIQLNNCHLEICSPQFEKKLDIEKCYAYEALTTDQLMAIDYPYQFEIFQEEFFNKIERIEDDETPITFSQKDGNIYINSKNINIEYLKFSDEALRCSFKLKYLLYLGKILDSLNGPSKFKLNLKTNYPLKIEFMLQKPFHFFFEIYIAPYINY